MTLLFSCLWQWVKSLKSHLVDLLQKWSIQQSISTFRSLFENWTLHIKPVQAKLKARLQPWFTVWPLTPKASKEVLSKQAWGVRGGGGQWIISEADSITAPWETQTHTPHTHTATLSLRQQHRKKQLSGSFHGNDNLQRWACERLGQRVYVHVCVHTVYWYRFRMLPEPPLPQPQHGMWSGLRKWRTQTHFKHRHAFFQQRSSNDKTFPHCLHMKFSDLLSALMDVAVELLGAVCQEAFFSFLCTLCLDCGLLLTSLWLQIHWHVIYRNEPWRKRRRINQTHPTCTVCVSHCVCLEQRERRQKTKKTNTNRHKGKVRQTYGLFYSFHVLQHKVLKKSKNK